MNLLIFPHFLIIPLSAGFEGEVPKATEPASNNRINRKRASEALLLNIVEPRNPFISSLFQHLCAGEGFFCLYQRQRLYRGVFTFHDLRLFDESSLAEKEANLFAAEYLLSDEEVLEVLNRDTTFFTAAAKLTVPVELLDFKFRIMK